METIKHSVPVKYNPFEIGKYPLNEFFRSKCCEFFEICETYCKSKISET